MNKTSIEWTHRPETPGRGFTWNPIRARLKGASPKARSGTFCTKISPGCTHCYASAINKRFGTGLEYTVPNLAEHEFFIDERILQEPLKQKKPATIFVGDMFDLFHDSIPDALIDRVMGAALHCAEPWHRCVARECDHDSCDENKLQEIAPLTFQFLTKRAERMQRYMSTPDRHERVAEAWGMMGWGFEVSPAERHQWPPKTSWFGVSVESQKYADERIPLLLKTPAAVRFLSVEPLLEEVDLYSIGRGQRQDCELLDSPYSSLTMYDKRSNPSLDWVICGGESGPGARPFNLEWARSLRDQCKAAGVPFFMKQVGSNPYIHGIRRPCAIGMPGISTDIGSVEISHHGFRLKDSKGGDMSEWPEDLRIREFPKEAVTA